MARHAEIEIIRKAEEAFKRKIPTDEKLVDIANAAEEDGAEKKCRSYD